MSHNEQAHTRAELVEWELMTNAYRLLPMSVLAIVVNSTTLSYAQYDVIAFDKIATWLGLTFIVTFWRFITFRIFRANPQKYSLKEWYRLFMVGVILSGMLWGLSALVLYPSGDIMHQAMLIIIIAGMSAGAISSLSSLKQAVHTFLILTLTPLILVLLSEGMETHVIAGILIFLFLVLVLIASSRFHRNIYETIETKLKYDEARQQLIESQEQLKEYNQELNRKVDEGVEKIREQDKLLIQQSKMASMGEMIGNIAHQWRQPLNALGLLIQDFKEAYQHQELDEKYIDDSVEKSLKQINYMSQSIDDFRNFFKPSKHKEEFSLFEALEGALSLLSVKLESSHIRTPITNYATDDRLVGYRNEYVQVLLNIINNAKDALIDKQIADGVVSIVIFEQDNFLSISIEDNGGGVESSVIDKIFDPYFTTKFQSQGTGLGLYMAKVMIEEHMGGKLLVTNTEQGAKFTIQTPRQMSDADAS
jgi:signal transduction histidine kinase